jgi:hypothetical protein
MESNLRPLSLGEILDRTAQLYRENFLLFAGIASVYAGVVLFLNLCQIGLNELMRMLHLAQQLPWVSIGFLVLILPLMFIFAGAAVAANNRAVAWVYLGELATIRGAYKGILPRLGRYLWLMTIVAFIIWGPFVVIYGGYIGLMITHGLFKKTPGPPPTPEASILLIVASLAFLLLITAWAVYAALMGLRYSLAVPCAVVEDLKARPALRRSIDLSKDSRGRIFLLALLVGAIQFGLVMLTQGPFLFVAVKHHFVIPTWAQILQQLVGFVTNSFIAPIYATGLTLFYYDQRIRKEGFDIEWMMQAAGLTVPAPAPPAPQSAPAMQSEFPVEAAPEPAILYAPQPTLDPAAVVPEPPAELFPSAPEADGDPKPSESPDE